MGKRGGGGGRRLGRHQLETRGEIENGMREAFLFCSRSHSNRQRLLIADVCSADGPTSVCQSRFPNGTAASDPVYAGTINKRPGPKKKDKCARGKTDSKRFSFYFYFPGPSDTPFDQSVSGVQRGFFIVGSNVVSPCFRAPGWNGDDARLQGILANQFVCHLQRSNPSPCPCAPLNFFHDRVLPFLFFSFFLFFFFLFCWFCCFQGAGYCLCVCQSTGRCCPRPRAS
jgi:hypothetical protein